MDGFPFVGGHRLHGQPRAFLKQHHSSSDFVLAQLVARQRLGESLQVLDVDHEPRGSVGLALGIVVRILRIEGRMVGISGSHNFRRAHDGHRFGIAVIEQHAVTDLHRVTEEIASLIVSYAIPMSPLVAREIVNGIGVGFRLEEPILARLLGHVGFRERGREERRVMSMSRRHAVQGSRVDREFQAVRNTIRCVGVCATLVAGL